MKTEPRHCDQCTACCDGWVRITVAGFEARPGHPCPHSTGTGCDDYANRPTDPCRNFHCGWVLPGSPLPNWMKPNRAGVIVLFQHRRWQGLPVDLALAVGRRIPGRAMDWLRAFAARHGRPLLHTEQVCDARGYTGEQTVYAHGPPAFREHLAERAARGLRPW